MSVVIGTIEKTWADTLPDKGPSIWSYNGFNGEELLRDVPLAQLGGLTVSFAPVIVVPSREKSLSPYPTIDLAFGEYGLQTDTTNLLKASVEQRGDDDPLTEALKIRAFPHEKLEHNGDELWTLPLTGIKPLKTPLITVNSVLPKAS